MIGRIQSKDQSLEDNLKNLIAYYKEEKGRLIALIADYLKEEEYELAHFHQQALFHLNGQLQTLIRFDDIHFDAKQRTSNHIDFLEKLIESTPVNELLEHLKLELLTHRNNLEHLNSLPKQVDPSAEGTLLQLTIDDLLEKRIQRFRLVLSKKENLLIAFSYSKNILKVRMPYVERLIDQWILHEEFIQKLILFGFQLTDNGNKPELRLIGDEQSIIPKLNVVLAKMVFEIFRTAEWKNESFIEMKGKANR
jgi:hypothetical protein